MNIYVQTFLSLSRSRNLYTLNSDFSNDFLFIRGTRDNLESLHPSSYYSILVKGEKLIIKSHRVQSSHFRFDRHLYHAGFANLAKIGVNTDRVDVPRGDNRGSSHPASSRLWVIRDTEPRSIGRNVMGKWRTTGEEGTGDGGRRASNSPPSVSLRLLCRRNSRAARNRAINPAVWYSSEPRASLAKSHPITRT